MVCLPIHDADYMGLSTEVGGRLGDVMQPVDPLLRLSRVCAQWQPLCIQHQRRMQMHTVCLRRSLVAPRSPPSPLHTRTGTVVDVGAVLKEQDRLLCAHPLDRSAAMRCQDMLGRDPLLVGLLFETIMPPPFNFSHKKLQRSLADRS